MTPRLLGIRNLFLAGNNYLPKVTIWSFVIKTRYGKLLHPNYLTALLNDLFGIQTRSGCFCAPRYITRILGFEEIAINKRFKSLIFEGHDIMKPGLTRFNIPYYFGPQETEYVV